MAHFALCPRAHMSPTAPTTLDTAMRPHSAKHANFDDPLTWQQQEDFGTKNTPKRRNRGRKAPKFVPLDLKAIESKPEVTVTDRTLTVQQPRTPVRDARSTTRGQAATRVPPHQSEQPVPANPAPPPQDQDTIPEKPRTNRKKRKVRGERKLKDMTAKPSGVYLAPHLRKRAAAPTEAKTEVELGDFVGIGSSPVSVKSQADKPVQSQILPKEVVAQDPTPLSPPTTVEEPTKPARGWSGWDDPLPEQPLVPTRRNENLRWPRAPKTPKERHVWPKSREIPKALSSSSQSDGGVAFKSDSEGDPSYDVKKLIAWNGDWLPPPEEWAARKGFTNRHFSQVIEQWANEHSRNCTKLMNIDSPAFSGVEDADGNWTNKDLVPRYWLHESIDNDAPRKFWEELLHRAPAALSDVDIMEDPPYWERWEDDHSDDCFMNTLVVPEARIDNKDSDNELESPFAMLCTTERLARINDIKKSRERRDTARRNRPIPNSAPEAPQMPDRRLQPKANIYLRPVQPADVRGVMTIYNHYAKHTVHSHELEEQTEATVRGRISDVTQAGLPFLVAVAKRNQRKGIQGYVSETIVGYIHLDHYVDQSSMYRYTFKLELYVHPGYIRQGIGKCLLDRMMYMANTGYNAKGGYEWVNDFEYLKNGKSRVIKTILATMHYERGDDVEWATGYLGNFGFKKAGRFAQIGHKDGKVIDKVMFQLQTTEVIDPRSVPMAQD